MVGPVASLTRCSLKLLKSCPRLGGIGPPHPTIFLVNASFIDEYVVNVYGLGLCDHISLRRREVCEKFETLDDSFQGLFEIVW